MDPANGNPIRAGIVVLNNNASALNMTLAAPRSGPQVKSGHDGVILRIVSVSKQQHQVVYPSNTISGTSPS